MSKTLITSRDPEGLRITGLFEATFNKAQLDYSHAQRLIEHGGELQKGIKKLIKELLVSNRYGDEEVKSRCGYFLGYTPKSITEQINILRQMVPGIGYAEEKIAGQLLPDDAEGWFAIPRWEKIAPTYSEAVQKVLEMISRTQNGKFYNYREGQLSKEHLRQHDKTEKMFQTLGDEQKDYDLLVVPAQFGLRHRGRSVRRTHEVFQANEFGLGAFAIGIMLLTHPERLRHNEDLWIDCAGDEFAPVADGFFGRAPFFSFSDGKVRFGTRWVGDASDIYGSASGFLA